jgi:hypothetical protein
MVPAAPLPRTIRAIPTRERVNAPLLLARRLIEGALIDATKTSRGKPTAEALLAREWLEADCDWTRKGVVPPLTLRQEGFPGSFDWCCRWLSLDPGEVRRNGLPYPTCSLSNRCQWRTRRRTVNRRNGMRYVAGLPDVIGAGARASER